MLITIAHCIYLATSENLRILKSSVIHQKEKKKKTLNNLGLNENMMV